MDKEDLLKGYLDRIIQTTEEISEIRIKTHDQKSFLRQRYYWLVMERKYLRRFFEGSLQQRIVVLPGLRGIGKTTLLFKAYNYLLNEKKIPKERLLYFDSADLKNTLGSSLKEILKVYEETYLSSPLEKSKEPLFLFIDEAHYDPEWEGTVQTIFNRSDSYKNVMIFVSGSSALALNSNPDLSRRMIRDHLYPLSFNEYLTLKKSFFPPPKTAEKIRIALNSEIESTKHILTSVQNDLQKKLTKDSINLEKELLEFLSLGASPLSFDSKSADLSFRWWNETLSKVTTQDIPYFSKIGNKSSPILFSLLQFLAESIPERQSYQSIAQKLNDVSNVTVFNMFEAMKNACLLFEVSPDVDALKKTNKASKYYFMHPTLRAALLWNIGKFKSQIRLNKTDTFGILLEEALAGVFFRNKNLNRQYILDTFFDIKKGGADFIVKTPTGNIAIECGWGKDSVSQVKKTMERIKCKFGILVTKTNSISLKDNILTIPRELLLFI